MILAVDPGTTESAYVCADEHGNVSAFGKIDNESLLIKIRGLMILHGADGWRLVYERIAAMGMRVGAEVFETCEWCGRFVEAAGGRADFVYRREVKIALCGSMRAKDADVRQVVIDRYGGKAKAIGTSRSRGVLYGASGDVWQALGVLCTYRDRRR